MQNSTFYDKKNAKGYLEPFWTLFPGLQNKKICRTMDNIRQNVVKNGVSVYFHGELLHFNCLKQEDLIIDFSFENLPEGNYGLHDFETGRITFNRDLKFDGSRMFSSIYHEYSHEIQRALSKHIDDYDKNSLEYQYLLLLKSEHEEKNIGAFEIFCTEEPYITYGILRRIPNESLIHLRTHDFISAIYHLQVMERNAFTTEQDAYDYLRTLDKSIESLDVSHQKESAQYIRKEYQAYGLSYEDICKTIDKAKLNIITQASPSKENDIEAGVTYDIIALLKLKYLLRKDVEKAITEYHALTSPEIKKDKLNNAYKTENKRFAINKNERIGDYEFVNDVRVAGIFTAENLATIDRDVQIRNPEMIIAALFYSGAEAVQYIKDVEAFKTWYYSNANNQSLRTLELVCGILGDEFSPEVKAKKNAEFKLEFKKQHPEYSKDIDYDNEDCNKEKYCVDKAGTKAWTPPEQKKSKEVDIER